MWMFFKKYLFFLVLCFTAFRCSATTVQVSSVKEPAMWMQCLEERNCDPRVIVILTWPNSVLQDHLHLLGRHTLADSIKVKKETERLLTVSFWEQPPVRHPEETLRVEFKILDLCAFYYPCTSSLFVFPFYSVYSSRKEGIPAVEGDYRTYENFPLLLQEVVRYCVCEQRGVATQLMCIGTTPFFFDSLKKFPGEYPVIGFCLEPLEEGKPSPVSEFVTTILGSPPRPVVKLLSLNKQPPKDVWEGGGAPRMTGLQRRLAALHQPDKNRVMRAFPGPSALIDEKS
jgi:hypothetical protein